MASKEPAVIAVSRLNSEDIVFKTFNLGNWKLCSSPSRFESKTLLLLSFTTEPLKPTRHSEL